MRCKMPAFLAFKGMYLKSSVRLRLANLHGSPATRTTREDWSAQHRLRRRGLGASRGTRCEFSMEQRGRTVLASVCPLRGLKLTRQELNRCAAMIGA